jgi:hypothetical protein
MAPHPDGDGSACLEAALLTVMFDRDREKDDPFLLRKAVAAARAAAAAVIPSSETGYEAKQVAVMAGLLLGAEFTAPPQALPPQPGVRDVQAALRLAARDSAERVDVDGAYIGHKDLRAHTRRNRDCAPFLPNKRTALLLRRSGGEWLMINNGEVLLLGVSVMSGHVLEKVQIFNPSELVALRYVPAPDSGKSNGFAANLTSLIPRDVVEMVPLCSVAATPKQLRNRIAGLAGDKGKAAAMAVAAALRIPLLTGASAPPAAPSPAAPIAAEVNALKEVAERAERDRNGRTAAVALHQEEERKRKAAEKKLAEEKERCDNLCLQNAALMKELDELRAARAAAPAPPPKPQPVKLTTTPATSAGDHRAAPTSTRQESATGSSTTTDAEGAVGGAATRSSTADTDGDSGDSARPPQQPRTADGGEQRRQDAASAMTGGPATDGTTAAAPQRPTSPTGGACTGPNDQHAGDAPTQADNDTTPAPPCALTAGPVTPARTGPSASQPAAVTGGNVAATPRQRAPSTSGGSVGSVASSVSAGIGPYGRRGSNTSSAPSPMDTDASAALRAVAAPTLATPARARPTTPRPVAAMTSTVAVAGTATHGAVEGPAGPPPTVPQEQPQTQPSAPTPHVTPAAALPRLTRSTAPLHKVAHALGTSAASPSMPQTQAPPTHGGPTMSSSSGRQPRRPPKAPSKGATVLDGGGGSNTATGSPQRAAGGGGGGAAAGTAGTQLSH